MFTTISLEDNKVVIPLLISSEFYLPIRIDIVTNFSAFRRYACHRV
jgi:hypothetical protein